MEALLIKVLSFLLAIGVLVSVHEFGHFWVARRLGIKVQRFSIGFGRPLIQRTSARDGTEYVLAAIPLGGYVKMLDEREGDVAPEEAHRAFNRQSLSVRSAVVLAGPLFNFLFAILAFWLVFMLGETGLRPLVGEVAPGSVAAQAGLRSGDEILAIDGEATPTWGQVVQELAAASMDDGELQLRVRNGDGVQQSLELPAQQLGDLAEVQDLLGHLGLKPERPRVPPIFGEVIAGEPAQLAGIRSGDRIVSADGQPIADWGDWVDYVRARPQQPIRLTLTRDGTSRTLTLVPAEFVQGDKTIGRIGASNQPLPEEDLARYRVVYRLGPLDAAWQGVSRTVAYSALTLKVIWRIVTGKASIRNLSGPFTIADAAGKTASYGLVYFLKFLAVVSISLGVINLMPIPVLDGGHLLYFAAEAVRGGPIPESWMLFGQKLGLLLLAGLMSLAFYVDIQRFFG
jgi:regulator of sigma E protease